MPSLVLLSVLAVVALSLAVAFYRVTLHPLARIPGPGIAAVTSFWQAHHVRNGHMRELAKTLHKTYGPVVRVGPNEVWFDSKEAVDVIYETNKERYRFQRRSLGPVYSIANVKKYEAVVDAVLDRFVGKLKTFNGKVEVDLAEWMHILALETLGSVVLDWSPGQIEAGSDEGMLSGTCTTWKACSVLGLFSPIVMVGGLVSPLKYLFPVLAGLVPLLGPGGDGHWRVIGEIINRRLREGSPQGRRPEGDICDDIFYMRLKKSEFTRADHVGMLFQNFTAGHDTIGAVMTAALALSCTDSRTQSEIKKELIDATNPTLFDNTKLLKYTQACIKESQRLYPVISMSLMRAVPWTGLNLHGYYFPPGTTVGCNPTAYHHNTAVFGENAGSFNPDRWLGSPEAHVNLDHAALTWGGANRRCPGQHLAQLICSKAFARLMKDFDIRVERPDDRDIPFYFLATMTGIIGDFAKAKMA
ncbi:uncharacterized protein JN550_010067 [Neoarthrinium moseri]|uniref:uncharacterized protein n=1 Tax=Neoarthrinium moseri TaxID=1658444 RepID=UPI001FDE9036|nr:uncharacterized protein JN550_010067 [Neoarthrinium moseri]KAI1862730.1 hypothetical protein JN550_010067 [Neoarthrinium moseri]